MKIPWTASSLEALEYVRQALLFGQSLDQIRNIVYYQDNCITMCVEGLCALPAS